METVEFWLYVILFGGTLYWLWMPFQGFVLFLPILLSVRARVLRAASVGDVTTAAPRRSRSRGLMPSDFRSITGMVALALPFVAALWLEVSLVLTLLPLWMAPVVAGLFWTRLRTRGVRHAHAIAWAALVAPGFATVIYLAPRIGSFPWQDPYWGGWTIFGYGTKHLAIDSSDLVGVAWVAVALLAGAVVASRWQSLRGFVDVLLLMTVPAFVLAALSTPFGVIYVAWCFAVAGFWATYAGITAGDRRRILPIERLAARGSAPAGAIMAGHDRWPTLRIVGALALASAVVLAVWSLLPADSGWRAVGEWLCITGIGIYGFARLRRHDATWEAAGAAIVSQLAAIAIFVAATDTIYLVSDGVADYGNGGDGVPGRLLLESSTSTSFEPQILGMIVLAFAASLVLSGGTRRFGALLVGASWPLVGALAYKSHELGLLSDGSAFSWQASQVWGAAIGATLAMALMWRVFGPDAQAMRSPAAAPAADAQTEAADAPSIGGHSGRLQEQEP